MDSVTICLIIFVLTIINFIWGKLSLATTALLSMMLFILTGMSAAIHCSWIFWKCQYTYAGLHVHRRKWF